MDKKTAYPGPDRFRLFTGQLNTLLTAAARQKNPALWLYRNNMRTPLFMLEGLSRLYAGIHNPKRFGKLKEQFKLLEDMLGAVDYHAASLQAFTGNKKIPAAVLKYVRNNLNASTAALNEVLAEKDWLGKDSRRLQKIAKKLEGADWLLPEAEMEAVKQHYRQQIAGTAEFINDTSFHFDNMEEDVHELRRRLRWLSIYPHALCGAIQLADNKPGAKHLKRYLTADVIASPYNQLPAPGNNEYVLELEKRYFLALSWIIAELGKIKDDGLHIVTLAQALQAASGLSEEQALRKAHQLAGPRRPSLVQLLDTAETTVKTFFTEKNLDQLVKGVKKLK